MAKKQDQAVLPSLDHFSLSDASHVYEPSEDTYLFCDALYKERDFLLNQQPYVALEVGSGSGCVITYLNILLNENKYHSCLCYSTDINPYALALTKKTAKLNNVYVEAIRTDLVTAVEKGLFHKVDVLLFNPPYVPSESDEIQGCGIEVSYAGGVDGREVIDRFLPKIEIMLSEKGVCYMVLVEENRPKQIKEHLLQQYALHCEIVLRCQAVNEALMIMKISR